MVRTQERDLDFVGIANGGRAESVNFDDGSLNYDRGVFANELRLSADLTLGWRNFGFFIRGFGFYDFETQLNDRERTDLSHDARRLIDELTDRGQMSLESVTFLRGRSLQRQLVVIDEAQNLEPTTLRTILTRVGEGTKVIFTGDTSQIDAPYLGESNNALTVLASAFADQRCFGHITLTACERSDVASLAAELL